MHQRPSILETRDDDEMCLISSVHCLPQGNRPQFVWRSLGSWSCFNTVQFILS